MAVLFVGALHEAPVKRWRGCGKVSLVAGRHDVVRRGGALLRPFCVTEPRLGRTESSAPTNGCRNRVPFNRVGWWTMPGCGGPGSSRPTVIVVTIFHPPGLGGFRYLGDGRFVNRPYGGLRCRLPCNRAGRASPPHPSASLTPSPQGEGWGGDLFPCAVRPAWVMGGGGLGRTAPATHREA